MGKKGFCIYSFPPRSKKTTIILESTSWSIWMEGGMERYDFFNGIVSFIFYFFSKQNCKCGHTYYTLAQVIEPTSVPGTMLSSDCPDLFKNLSVGKKKQHSQWTESGDFEYFRPYGQLVFICSVLLHSAKSKYVIIAYSVKWLPWKCSLTANNILV